MELVCRSSSWLQISMVREKGMECLVDEGWQLEKWRYIWRLVGVKMTTTHIDIQKHDLEV